MERSRKLVLKDWTKANDALIFYFEGNKSKLAEHIKMSRTTVTAFFKQEPVREAEYRKLCLALRLRWQEVSKAQAIAPQLEHEIEPLQQLREHCRQKILSLHSRMRLLSGEAIGVDQLYVDVWLLNRSPRTFQVSQDKLLQNFDLRNDRLGLGDRIKRKPGLETANANAKLLILGKPGSGKTTFLKHLAVNWCKGHFQSDLIAVFIEFRRVQDRKWQLLDAIGKELGLDEGPQIRALKQKIKELKGSTHKSLEEEQQKEKQVKGFQQKLETLLLQILLKEGKLLVLMDGLDEVPTSELRRNVRDQLQQIAEDYVNSRLILTCRTQIIESIPDGFTSVEVADFSLEQVQQFVQNWFKASGHSDVAATRQWEKFEYTVGRNVALRELVVTPVLLSLMCLVLHDEGDMPSQITDLFRRGIRLLLEKWNNAKAIEGWEIGSETYRQLSVEQKEALLIEIAARKFENPKNFVLFEEAEIAAQITQFLRLTNCKSGVAVLKAIEAQHGLLIERADGLWSFSHLTFQEHFTIQWLMQLLPEELSEKIANSQWQKVVKQLVQSQQSGTRLVRLIKLSIDRSIAGKRDFNQFLTWVLQKSGSIQADYKPAALRAVYFTLARDLALTPDLDLDLDHALNRVRAGDFNHALARDLALDITLALALALARARTLDITPAFNRDLVLARALDLDLDLDLNHILNHALTLILDADFVLKLEQLRTKLPSSEDRQQFQHWWQEHGHQWLKRLRQVIIDHRNIGHCYQFTKAQQQQLQRYYDANRFLFSLMKIQDVVSQEFRAEVEDNLLLPWEELQRRDPETYGKNDNSERIS